MGKKLNNTNNKQKSIINGKYYPLVSVCTPTFNRRPFISTMLECFRNQTYPKHRIEWIIVDDGSDKIKDLIDSANISQIKYFSLDKKMALGEKRNYMHKQVKGSIIVYMDDDDYYPPERISHAVDTLMNNKEALCAGSSEIYIYFKHIQKMYQCGPYGPKHATAGTFAFKTELLKQTHYEDHAALAEERHFLKNYTVPFVQLDPMKTILVFSHNHNTFDKRKLLENPHPNVFKVSEKKVEDFINKPEEKKIKEFFMKDIDGLLEKYDPGDPKWKPDVLVQLKQIEEDRMKMMQNNGESQQQIMMSKDGGPPVVIPPNEVIKMLNDLQMQVNTLTAKVVEKENILTEKDNLISILQKQLLTTGTINTSNKDKDVKILSKDPNIEVIKSSIISENSKCDPVIKLNISD
jgi:glycosyltransferase involved in cell wall biosynthesis